MMQFEVVGVLNTGQNFIYTLKSESVMAKFKSKMKRWKFGDKVEVSDEQLEKEAYQIEKI
jgi:hypothetical protein